MIEIEFIKRIKIKLKEKRIAKKYGVPLFIRDEWYNYRAHSQEKSGIVIFDDNKRYIDCRKGNIVKYIHNGRLFLYEITAVRTHPGGDYFFKTDSIHCDLKFIGLYHERD